MKKWHWNSVFGLEAMMEFFHSLVSNIIVNGRTGGGACSVDVFCAIASLEGMLESVLAGHFGGDRVWADLFSQNDSLPSLCWLFHGSMHYPHQRQHDTAIAVDG